jgi:hypothetical protein
MSRSVASGKADLDAASRYPRLADASPESERVETGGIDCVARVVPGEPGSGIAAIQQNASGRRRASSAIG